MTMKKWCADPFGSIKCSLETGHGGDHANGHYDPCIEWRTGDVACMEPLACNFGRYGSCHKDKGHPGPHEGFKVRRKQ